MAKEDLAASLEHWASSYKVSSDPFVIGLSQSIKSGDDLAAYSELNPLDYLPTPVHVGNERSSSLQNTLTIIRNILVFFPVALTWIAVSKSTSAFASYTEANKSAVVNFLEFWQSGYGVLSKSWTIGHVAFLDFLIIVIVIALTLVTAFMHNKNIAAAKAHMYKSEADRTAIGLKLHIYLHQNRAVTPTTINATVARAVKDLAATAKSLEKSSKVLQKDINQIPSNKAVLSEVKRLVTGVKAIRKSATSKSRSKQASNSLTSSDFDFDIDSYFPKLD